MSRPVCPALSFCAPLVVVLVVRKEIIGKEEELNEEKMKVHRETMAQNNSMCDGPSRVAVAACVNSVASAACAGPVSSCPVPSLPDHPVQP